MGFKLTQDEYEQIVFLTKCIYVDDLVYPSSLGFQHSVVLLTGLRMNLFIGKEFDLFIICGTNSFRDWIANSKIALHITPRQHQQALKRILQHYSTMDKNKPLIIAGHSLGGSISTFCKSFMANDVYCITFNACPSMHISLNSDGYSNVLNIVSKHDILNCICDLIPTKKYMKHTGKVIKIKDKYRYPSVKSHCDFSVFINFKIDEVDK